MYLFTSALVLNIEEQKYEKDIEQDISSNATKLRVCRKIGIKVGHSIVIEVLNLI